MNEFKKLIKNKRSDSRKDIYLKEQWGVSIFHNKIPSHSLHYLMRGTVNGVMEEMHSVRD